MRLSDDQMDALTEVVNIGAGRAAASLSELVGERIGLSVPSIVLCDERQLADNIQARGEEMDLSILQDFEGGVSGRALLVFPHSSAITLGQVVGGLDDTHDQLDLDLCGILEEVGNIVLSGVLGSIGNLLGSELQYSVPKLVADTHVAELVAHHCQDDQETNNDILLADVRLDVASRHIGGSLVLAFRLGRIEAVLQSVLGQQTTQ